MDNEELTLNPFGEEPALAPWEPLNTNPPIPCQLCLDPDCWGH